MWAVGAVPHFLPAQPQAPVTLPMHAGPSDHRLALTLCTEFPLISHLCPYLGHREACACVWVLGLFLIWGAMPALKMGMSWVPAPLNCFFSREESIQQVSGAKAFSKTAVGWCNHSLQGIPARGPTVAIKATKGLEAASSGSPLKWLKGS